MQLVHGPCSPYSHTFLSFFLSLFLSFVRSFFLSLSLSPSLPLWFIACSLFSLSLSRSLSLYCIISHISCMRWGKQESDSDWHCHMERKAGHDQVLLHAAASASGLRWYPGTDQREGLLPIWCGPKVFPRAWWQHFSPEQNPVVLSQDGVHPSIETQCGPANVYGHLHVEQPHLPPRWCRTPVLLSPGERLHRQNCVRGSSYWRSSASSPSGQWRLEERRFDDVFDAIGHSYEPAHRKGLPANQDQPISGWRCARRVCCFDFVENLDSVKGIEGATACNSTT